MSNNFFLSKEEAIELLKSYREQIKRSQKELDAIVSLAFLLGKYIDELPRESDANVVED